MKVLLDSCVWGGARDALTMAGHDVESVADWPADPGDAEVLAHASRTRSVLVTLDKDFGELAIVRGHPHAASSGLSATARRNWARCASRPWRDMELNSPPARW